MTSILLLKTKFLLLLHLDGDDKITGGTAADIINSGAGADTIIGGGGTDTINTGAGNDNITGGTAVDTIDAGAGDDIIHGNGGKDVITGGTGDDIFAAGPSGVADAPAAANAIKITDFEDAGTTVGDTLRIDASFTTRTTDTGFAAMDSIAVTQDSGVVSLVVGDADRTSTFDIIELNEGDAGNLGALATDFANGVSTNLFLALGDADGTATGQLLLVQLLISSIFWLMIMIMLSCILLMLTQMMIIQHLLLLMSYLSHISILLLHLL